MKIFKFSLIFEILPFPLQNLTILSVSLQLMLDWLLILQGSFKASLFLDSFLNIWTIR